MTNIITLNTKSPNRRTVMNLALRQLKGVQRVFRKNKWNFMVLLIGLPIAQLEDNFEGYVSGAVDENADKGPVESKSWWKENYPEDYPKKRSGNSKQTRKSKKST